MTIKKQIKEIQLLIKNTAESCHRDPKDISLLAVTKSQPASVIREAYNEGLRHFAESYWQEADKKIEELKDLDICWHFIGPIQSNKVASIANAFSWVHSLSREKIALMLAKNRFSHFPPLNVCIQVNLDSEDSKSGVAIDELSYFAQLIQSLPTLKLRGLMAIPKPRSNEEQQFLSLERLKNLFLELNKELHLNMDTLSMGMSDDLKAAIKAGSTMVRVGRAIFGERQ